MFPLKYHTQYFIHGGTVTASRRASNYQPEDMEHDSLISPLIKITAFLIFLLIVTTSTFLPPVARTMPITNAGVATNTVFLLSS